MDLKRRTKTTARMSTGGKVRAKPQTLGGHFIMDAYSYVVTVTKGLILKILNAPICLIKE